MKKPKKLNYDLKEEFDTKEDFLNYISHIEIPFVRTNKKIEYANIPCAFDIETSSFYDANKVKTAIMYCFTLGVNGHSYLGRTWNDLFEMLDVIQKTFNLNLEHRLIIYIHNLGYEFQFIYKRFKWYKVFATQDRTPLTALTTSGIEFRCSYLLSGYSLKETAKHLQKYPCQKMVGDLDYSLIRHSKTSLTDKEKGYVLNDGIIVMNYIQEQIESHGGFISRIPLTKTGEVRKYCRNECLYGGGGSHKKSINQYFNYRKIMNATQIRSVNEYKQLKRAFMGGFTHANALIVGNKIHDVTSFDFTSSYPYVMVSEKFPMLAGELITIKNKADFEKNLNLYCCLFDITFIGLESIIFFEHYISHSHCRDLENYQLDNGRIVRADRLTITITEQDFFIIKKCYSWDKMIVVNFRRYKRDYLPHAFVRSILYLYKKKTELKGVKGSEIEYLHSKELLNSCYGMSVTDICRVEREFDVENNQWKPSTNEIDYEKNILKYNKSKQRFLSYAWGVWVTAYARRNLWMGIMEFKEDYLYSDTDSIKVINTDKHMKFINDYDEQVKQKLIRAMNHHGFDFDYVEPRSIDGKPHLIGVWDREYHAINFKTLGAKRYMITLDDGKNSLTISGLNKKIVIPYLESKNTDIFEEFKEDMYIPKGYTGKNIHTYIDEERSGIITDYLGTPCEYHELSCVHMEESDYTLSLAREYVDFLLAIKLIEYN